MAMPKRSPLVSERPMLSVPGTRIGLVCRTRNMSTVASAMSTVSVA